MELLPKKNGKKSEYTRIQIAEAIIEMLKTKELSDIRISAIVLKAKVSRMTFYNNYETIADSLKDYIHIIFGRFVEEAAGNADVGEFRDYSHILFALEFFDRYRTYFMVIRKRGLHYLLLEAMNEFMQTYFNRDNKYKVYELYCYAGGLMNVFLEWEGNKKPIPAADVARTIVKLYNCNSIE